MGEVRDEQPANRARASASVMAIDGVKVAGLELKIFFLGRISSRRAIFAPLPRLDQRVKQHQVTVFPGGEIMGNFFRDVAKRAGLQHDAPAVDP